MANKLNLEGFTVSTADVCTADGGFVGNLTGVNGGAESTYTTITPEIAATDSVALLDASSNAVAATIADGVAGQSIVIYCSNADSAVTLVENFKTYTFDVTDSITLTWLGVVWVLSSNVGVVVS